MQLALPLALTGRSAQSTSLAIVSLIVTVAVVRSPRLPSAACVTWALSGTETTSLPPVGASTVAGPV